MATRWAIAGTGLISNDFANAMHYLGTDDHVLVSVASRHLKDAQEFAKTWGAKRAYEGYDELAKDPEVDVVYVGVINPYHFRVTKLLLESGKHVLCEKAMCLSVADVKELVELARKKKLFLMEAIWSRCFPIYQKIPQILAEGTLGKVAQVNATFGKALMHVPRVTDKEMGGGVTFDIGVYAIQFATLAFGGKKPIQIKAVGEVANGVDLAVSVSMLYEGGGVANLSYTARCNLNCNAMIGGTNGSYIEVSHPFWSPESLVMPDSKVLESPLPKFEIPVNFGNSEGLIYEATEVRRCLKQGLKESPLVPLDQSIIIAEITEEIRRQLGTL